MKIEISPLIEAQVFEAIVMFFAGMTVMLSFQLYNLLKKKANPNKYISFIVDIIFWILAAILTTLFLNYAAFGKISFHSAAAFVVGLVLWKISFYGIISK